jgi:hypothetical protein
MRGLYLSRRTVRCTLQERLGEIFLGLIGFAPIYLNGLLAIFFVFVFPGLVFVRIFDIPSFPQRWLAVFLASLTTNHFLVTLTAAFQLDPLQTYRAVAAALIAALFFMIVRKGDAARTPVQPGASVLLLSDVKWLVGSLVVLGFTYFNIWKHGVPNIFHGSDVSVSWNAWSLIWSHGLFPTASYGYPQFVPTTWAATYIFTGSTEQYFAYYTYVVLIIVPIVLCMSVLGRLNWRYAVFLLLEFAWFVAEIREPWLRFTLQAGFPDWVAAIIAFCGTVLFVVNAPGGRLDGEKAVTALLSLCLVSIAAATKPIYGLFTIAILIAICTDAAKHLQRAERNRFIIAAVGLVAIFVTAYAINYSHLTVRSMPNYPVPELSERLSRAAKLFNSNFTLPFRTLLFAGLALSPFLPRIRWLALPLGAGFWLWANTASYDLRNLLGLVLIGAFIPLHVIARRFVAARDAPREQRWRVRDGAVAAGVAVLCVVLTLPLALSDEKLKQRFADEQLSKGMGIELNEPIGKLLARGCTIYSADAYIYTVSAFQPYQQQLQFFHFTEPLTDQLAKQLNESTGCTSIVYPPSHTHPSILYLISALADSRGYTKVTEHNGMTLLISNANSPTKN